MLAGMNAYGTTKIVENQKSRDHTERMILSNSNVINIKNGKKKLIKIFGRNFLNPINVEVPGDPSSAAFFTALVLLIPNSSLRIKNIGLNPTRIGFYEILKKHGAKVKFVNLKVRNNEKRGDMCG